MNATENVRKCFALYCKLDEREVEYLNAMIVAKGMLSGVEPEPKERRGPGRPKGARSKPKTSPELMNALDTLLPRDSYDSNGAEVMMGHIKGDMLNIPNNNRVSVEEK